MRFVLPLLFGSLLATACATSHEEQASSDVTEARCEARFHNWQKDAHASMAGRNYPFWPAHTTTELEVICGKELVAAHSMANHGTDVGATDTNGDVILVETAAPLVLTGTRSQLRALVDSYAACSCESSTTFLSLDALDDTLTRDLIDSLKDYLRANLTCDGGVEALLAMFESGAVEKAIAAIPSCAWKDGNSLAEGLDEAVRTLAEGSKKSLENYHVCNNDAALQRDLIEQFRDHNVVTACDAASAICRGPVWFYEP